MNSPGLAAHARTNVCTINRLPSRQTTLLSSVFQPSLNLRCHLGGLHSVAALSMHKRSAHPLPVSRPIIYPGTLPTPEAAAAAKAARASHAEEVLARQAKEAERKAAAKRSAERSRAAKDARGRAGGSRVPDVATRSGGSVHLHYAAGRYWKDAAAYENWKKKSGAPLPESLARKFPGKTATHISNMLAQANRMDPGDELELPELSDDERKWLRTHY